MMETDAEKAVAAAAYAREEFIKISYQLQDISRRLSAIESENKVVQERLADMYAVASKWKGGFLVIIGIGGLITWISGVGGNIMKILK